MPERPSATLRVEPHMIPALAAAYDRAAYEVGKMLEDIRSRGRLPRPWTSDPVTIEVANQYHERVLDGPQSAYSALRLYERELTNIRDTLRQMEADYRRTEGDNAALWGRL